MRKLFFLFLIWPFLCHAQNKPSIAVLQPGWADSCLRAIPLTEGIGTTPSDLTGKSTPSMTANTWNNDAEGFYFDATLVANANIDFDTGLPGSNVDKYTVYVRVIEFVSGASGPYYSTFNGALANSDVQLMRSNITDRRINFAVQNATNCATCTGNIDVTISPNTKYNIIAEYDGDSLRTWLNNVRDCSAKLTSGGNIKNSGYTSRVAHGHNQVSDGCQGSTGAFGTIKLFTIVIWKRLLTTSERTAIQNDPYVMFRVPTLILYHFKNGGFKNSEFKNAGFKNAGFK